MAKIKLGALAQDVRGSLAGTTFSRNRFGSYARQKVSPVQPLSARQLAQRSILTLASQAWRNLTSAQRAQWEAYAGNHPVVDVFGDSVTLSGNGVYSRINADRLTLSLAQVATPPADPDGAPAAATAAAAAAGAGTVTVTTAAQAASTGYYEVWTTPGLSAGARAQRSQFRLAYADEVVDLATSIVVTPATFNDRLGFVEAQVLGVLVVRFSPEGVRIDVTRFDVTAAA